MMHGIASMFILIEMPQGGPHLIYDGLRRLNTSRFHVSKWSCLLGDASFVGTIPRQVTFFSVPLLSAHKVSTSRSLLDKTVEAWLA